MASGFSAKNVGLRMQKKIMSKLSTKSIARTFIDDEMSQLLDVVHLILSEELGQTKADKVVKNMIKITVKVGILYKNNQFNDDEQQYGFQLRKKLRHSALTVISFYQVDFSFDSSFLIQLIEEIGKLLHDLIHRHLTQKSHMRIDTITEAFKRKDLLDKVFISGSAYNSHLPAISQAFEKVVDSEW